MRIRLFLFVIISILFISGCGQPPEKGAEENMNEMVWSNPISYPDSIEEGKGFRDPFILKDGDWWYLTGTMFPHFEGDQGHSERTKGVPLYKTKNFRDWEFVDIILKRPDPSENKWYQNYFWAPELFQCNGKYYLTVNCSVKGHYEVGGGQDTLQAVCLAVADSIEGPYTVITEEKPIIYENDASLFADDDGKIYLFCGGISAAQIDLDHGKLISSVRRVIAPVPKSAAWNAQRDGVGFEGAYAMKRGGIYYLFYSTWARGYEIGIAESAEFPVRGWTLHENPFYGAMNQGHCDFYKATYEEGYYAYPYREAGHNSIFLGPDGSDWIAAHVFEEGDKNEDIKLVIDRLEFDGTTFFVRDSATGERVNGPTYGEQKADISDPKKSEPVKALDSWAWRSAGEAFSMPEKADILFENGWRESYPVVWDNEISTAAAGEQTAAGQVTYDGRTFVCRLTVTVK